MNILHIAMGSPEFDRAAKELGHYVSRIPWREILGKRFTNDANALQPIILKEAERFKPELIFAQTHQSEVVSPSTYDALRKMGAFVVNWCGDVRDPLPDCYTRIAKHVDVMAFSNLTDVELIRAKGYRSEYLQIGYDPEIYYPGNGQDRSGVVFMANHYQGRFPNTQLRRDVALRLMKEFPKDFTLYGSGWHMPGIRPAPPDLEAHTYRSALVAVNVDHFTRPHFASDRILRAQACGCAVVGMDYPGLKDEHPNVYVAKDIDGLVRKVKYLLNDAGLAKDKGTANAGHVVKAHTWANRIETMIAWMQ